MTKLHLSRSLLTKSPPHNAQFFSSIACYFNCGLQMGKKCNEFEKKNQYKSLNIALETNSTTFIFLANFSYFLPYMSQVVQYILLNVDCTVLLFRKCECISTMKIIWNSKLYRDNKYYICIWVIWWFSNAHFEKLLRDSIQNRFKSLRYTTQTSISFSFSNWKIEELK